MLNVHTLDIRRFLFEPNGILNHKLLCDMRFFMYLYYLKLLEKFISIKYSFSVSSIQIVVIFLRNVFLTV